MNYYTLIFFEAERHTSNTKIGKNEFCLEYFFSSPDVTFYIFLQISQSNLLTILHVASESFLFIVNHRTSHVACESFLFIVNHRTSQSYK